MRNKHIILFILLLMIINCRKNSTGINHELNGITLKIIDKDNKPLSNVDLHYIFHLGYFEIIRNPSISFSINKADTGTLKIFYPLSGKEMTILEDRLFLPGIHSIIISSSKYKLTNGIYHYSLELNNKKIKNNFPIIYDNIDTLITYEPLTKSDDKGEIFLSYDIFHIDENFGNDQIERTIADSIMIILFKSNFQIYQKAVRPEENKNIKLNCILIEQ